MPLSIEILDNTPDRHKPGDFLFNGNSLTAIIIGHEMDPRNPFGGSEYWAVNNGTYDILGSSQTIRRESWFQNSSPYQDGMTLGVLPETKTPDSFTNDDDIDIDP